MPAIPVYQRQAAIGAAVPSVQQAGAVPQTDAGARALAGIAQTGEQLLNTYERTQAEAKRLADERNQGVEAVASANVLSQADNYWSKQVAERSRAWKMGDPDLTIQLDKEFEQWIDETAGKFTDPKVRQHFQVSAFGMRQRYTEHAFKAQDQLTTEATVAQFGQAAEADEEAVYRDPSRRAEVMVRSLEALNNINRIPEGKRTEIGAKLRDRFNLAAERGELDRDPAGYYARRFGTFSMGTNGTGAPSTPGFVDAGRVFGQGMVWAESRGQQFDSNGRPLTSAAGAVGAAQVMPATGPEAAKLAGLPWDAERLRTDKDYNLKLGQAYFNEQLRAFGGDFTKAIAAYNAGPGRVDALVKRHGDNWLEHAPDETQGYVRTVAARLGLAGPGRGFEGTQGPATLTVLAPPDKGPESFEALPYEKRETLRAAAEAKIRQNETVFRQQTEVQVRNATAMHADGILDPAPIPLATFQRAYGPEQGAAAFQSYAAGRDMAGAISRFKLQSPAEIERQLLALKPSEKTPDYAAADQRFQIAARAAQAVVEQREKDPMAWAAGAGLAPGVARIDMAQPDTLGAQLPLRAALSATLQSKYGVRNPALLMPDEAKALTTALQSFPTPQKLVYLEQMRTALRGDDAAFRRVMQQVAPDSPVTAVAASILTQQRGPTVGGGLFSSGTPMQPNQVAQVMLEGEQLLNPGKGPKGEDGKGARWPMPKEADFAGEFADKVGDAFAGDPRGYEVAYQAVRAYYAGAAARQGLIDASKADPKLLGEAIEAATGGVSRVNGKPVLRPWGMHEGEFKAGLQSQFQQAVAANGWAGTPFADFDAFRLRALGGGRYLLGNGADAAVYGRDGRPVVLTLDAGERAAPIPGVGRPAPVATEPSAASRIPPVWR